MKPEDKKIFYISIGMIVFLGLMSFWRLKTFKINESSNYLTPSYKEIEFPKFDNIFSEENLEKVAGEIGLDSGKNEKNIIYTRKIIKEKIRFDYPSSWMVSDEEQLEGLNVLFVAYEDKAIYPSVVSVVEMETESPEVAIEMLKQEIEKDGRILDASLQKTSDEEYLSTISVNYSKELRGIYVVKTLLINNKSYLFSVASFDEKSSISQDIIDYIISSIQIIA
jgi:hypothetical protein